MSVVLFDKRTILFLPASNPRAIAKARASAADLVVLDLEDAVKPADKDRARAAAVEAVAEDWPMPVAIRVNGTASEWHAADVAAVAGSKADLVIVPRVSSASEIETVAASRADLIIVPRVAGASEIEAVAASVGRPVAAMIETAAGVLAAPSVARVAAALIAGTNDLSADLRLPEIDRNSLSFALQSILVAARAARIPAFDGVYNRLDDPAGLAAECADSRRLGFDG